MKKPLLIIFMCLLLVSSFFSGCKGSTKEEYDLYLYYREVSRDSLRKVPARLDETMEQETMISSIWSSLKMNPGEEYEYISAIPEDLELSGILVSETNLVMNLSDQYPESATPEELLLRAAIVLTFVQLDSVTSVEIRIDGKPLTDREGRVIGSMNAESFTDVPDTSETILFANSTVYYSDITGTRLVPAEVTLAYEKNTSVQQAVLQRLILGPDDVSEGYEVLPEDTKLISILLKDGICHVNLNSAIINEPLSVSSEVQIYSIVNSLTEIEGISEVLISINGSSNIIYDETIDLSKPLMRNLDLVNR